MNITKTEKYTQIKPIDNSVEDFFKSFENQSTKFSKEHLIIDFSEKINIKIEELLLFLKVSEKHRESGTSFVIVYEGVEVDEIPDEINIVPTLIEAMDILEMDAIERDLGF